MKFARPAFVMSAVLLTMITVVLTAETRASLRSSEHAPLVRIRVPTEANETVPPETWKREFLEGWFTSHLHEMGEPSLWQISRKAPEARLYRVLALPSFSPSFAVRLARLQDGSARMHVTVLDGSGGFDPGRLKARSVTHLPSEKFRELETLFQTAEFWTDRIGVLERKDRPEVWMCTDGVTYVVEAVTDGSYKLVTRDVCEMEDAVRSILNAFAEMAGTERVPKLP